MSVRKRKGSPYYWCFFTVGGRRVRESTETTDKGKAEEYEARLKQRLWEEQRLGRKPGRPWQDAVVRWCKEKAHKKSFSDDLSHFRWLDQHLGQLCLHEIDEEQIELIVEAKLDDDVANATVNRMLSVLRAVLNRACRNWRWTDRAPIIEMLPVSNERVRWLTAEEAARLLAELPIHLRMMADFTLETGLRAANVKGLKWRNIDMQRHCAWVNASDSKSGKALGVPLSTRAIEILRSQMGNHLEYVFTYKPGRTQPPQPIKWGLRTKAWLSALERANITDFRWHDLRHTWASWHVQSGTPLHVLKELGGWSSMDLVLRYAHLNPDHLRDYTERGTNLTHRNMSAVASTPIVHATA